MKTAKSISIGNYAGGNCSGGIHAANNYAGSSLPAGIVATLLVIGIFILTSCQDAGGETTGSPPPVDTVAPAPSNTPAPSETSAPTNTPLPPTSTKTAPITPSPSPTDTPTITPTFSPDTLVFRQGEPLKIGYLLWTSNPLGLDSKRGIEIAIQDFGGELLGHPIELVGYDDECNQLAGQRGAQLLALDDTVVGIIGSTCSTAAMRAAPIVSNAAKVLISPSATNPDLTSPDSHPAGFFRTAPNDIYQFNAAAQYAINNLNRRKLASIYTANNKAQRLWSEHVCTAFSELGGECVLERGVESGTTYMVPVVNAILESGADVVHLTLGNPQEAATLISQLKSTPGLEDTAIFLWELLNSADFLRQAGESAVGVYVATTAYDFDQGTIAYQSFLVAYRQKYGENPPSAFHAFAYDAANLLLHAIEQVAVQDEDGMLRVDPLAVRVALYRLTDFPGMTGSLSCSELGDCAGIVGGRVYQFTSGDPDIFNPGPASSLSSNPSQVWP